jgi:hypothetical protein
MTGLRGPQTSPMIPDNYHYGPRNKNHRIFWDKTLASIMASATPFCFCTTQKHLTVKRLRSSRV